LVFNRFGAPARVTRIDVISGAREVLRQIEAVGGASLATVLVTPDGKTYAYGSAAGSGDLFLATDLTSSE
jgi:hypothetical protein